MGAAALNLPLAWLEYWARPQILCARAEEASADAPRICALAQALRAAAAAAGFAPDLKPFHAHVTVARKVMRPVADQPITPLRWSCTYFALLASRTSANGSVYSVVESYPLVKPENARK
jgi:2'-5' RNA ligase